MITYGLLVYGAAPKTSLKKIEAAQKRILRAILFKKKFDSLRNDRLEYKFFTVFELYCLEVIEELFRQLQLASPSNFLQSDNVTNNSYNTRSKEKGLLRLHTSRTLIKQNA